MPENPDRPTSVRPRQMLLRGMRRRCPFCGGGGLFDSWLKMKPACPTCKHHFSREEGFYVGAYAINFVIAEGLVMVFLVAYIVISQTRPEADLPVLPFFVAGVAGAIVAPLIFWPFSRTIWVAIDMMIRGGRNIKG